MEEVGGGPVVVAVRPAVKARWHGSDSGQAGGWTSGGWWLVEKVGKGEVEGGGGWWATGRDG